MRSVHDKSNKRAALFLWTKDTRSRQFGEAVAVDAENDDPVRLIYLRRGDAGPSGILHGFDHVLNEAAHPRSRRIFDDRSGIA